MEKVFNVIKGKLPAFKPSHFIDVGANVGQTTGKILDLFPDTHIVSIEPSPDAFDQLQADFGKDPRVDCHNLALSRVPGTLDFLAVDKRTDNRIVASSEPGTISVEATTGDVLLERVGLTAVDYLKIDTEGHDIDVLAGFLGALANGAIGFVEVEVGVNAQNRRHVSFERMHAFMEVIDYPLFTLHELAWTRKSPIELRRLNAVFASKKQFG